MNTTDTKRRPLRGIIQGILIFSLSVIAARVQAQSIDLNWLGSHKTGIYNQGAAEIVAHDPATQRLFFIEAANGKVVILDAQNPASPTPIDTLTMPDGFLPNSVAVKNGLVAVAAQAPVKTDAGKVFFYNTSGALLNSVAVGALPDMVTFTPDGTKVLTANEGEPNSDYTIDPEGTVSIIDVSGGAASAFANTLSFSGFNNKKDWLRANGIRIFGPNAAVAQDIEPEYIAVSPDNSTAYVTLQENNAFAIIDLMTNNIILKPLGFKDHLSGQPKLETFTFDETALPALGSTPAGQVIKLGGFSGLFFEGMENGKYKFITHPDRGPNAEPIDILTDKSGKERPFPLPNFQTRLIRFTFDPQNGQLAITDSLLLRTASGKPVTGLPNLQAGAQGTAYTDEYAIDLNGNLVANDTLGGDFEGIAIAADGSFWMVDEYRPAIYHFHPNGVLINRYIPEGTAASVGAAAGTFGEEVLPAVYAQRRSNRGFEAVAIEGQKVYAFIQSPIDNPDVASDANSKASYNLRIVEFDTLSRSVTAEYLYVLEGLSGTDKLGDAASIGNGRMLVAERDDNTGSLANKSIFEIDLKGATNLMTLSPSVAGPGGTLDKMSYADLVLNGIKPVYKRKVANVPTLGYVLSDKLEGLAKINDSTFAVINDNDFSLDGTVPSPMNGSVGIKATFNPIVFGLLKFDGGNELDASDKDNTVAIKNWPVLGMYQPDAIAAYTANDGKTYVVTANEGDASDYSGFAEEKRIKDVSLDATAFPTASTLKGNSALGRLNITSALGDIDGDGDFDRLFSYGARSFSIRDAAGNLVYDSGNRIEQVTADSLGSVGFNSDNAANASFDTRSDNKGPEPEAVAVGKIGDSTYAFIGLERTGGIMVYNITDPKSPAFVQYVNHRDFSVTFAGSTPTAAELDAVGDLGPEGIIFISGSDSPNSKPMLVVANEISGTVSLYQIDRNTSGVVQYDPKVPKDFALGQNYPNPFNPSTTISYQLSKAANVTLKVYDLLGRQVTTLVSAKQPAGKYSIAFNASRLASGVYFYSLKTDSFVQSKKMVLIK